MDASTLYLVIALASGGEFTLVKFPLSTEVECWKTARHMRRGKLAEHYRRDGTRVKVFCGPWQKPLVIAR